MQYHAKALKTCSDVTVDVSTVLDRRRIVRRKKFLRRTYDEWYSVIASRLPARDGPVLELGSGAGFLEKYIPGLITSDVFPCEGVQRVIWAEKLPFADASLRAIVMTDVFHHMSRPRQFLAEATRCLVPGGRVVMVEPWNTPWSRWIYTRFHHEPFCPASESWECEPEAPLAGANGALPWIVFDRDRSQFEREFPLLSVLRIELTMPLRYVLSGGFSITSLMTGW